RHFIELKHSDGGWVRYPVDYTIGSKWQQAYATRLPNGQIHVFPLQYSLLHQRWINFWKVIDPENSERADVRTFEKFTEATSYQANWGVCHTSKLQTGRVADLRLTIWNSANRVSIVRCVMDRQLST